MNRNMHLYVATDGDIFKIGISTDPVKRMASHGKSVRLIKSWRRPYARQLEADIKGILAYCCVRGSEWFRIEESDMLFQVQRTIRIYDDERAIKAGREPSSRQNPAPPEFSLEWMEATP